MEAPVLLCTDGSELALEALRAGLDLLHPDAPRVVVSVTLEPDPTLVTGTGMAGGVMSPETFQQEVDRSEADARTMAEEAVAALGLGGATVTVLHGDPAAAICEHATDVAAGAIVIGTRGRGGIKRAVLGSVSDHVIRHAPCPVVVVTAQGADPEPG